MVEVCAELMATGRDRSDRIDELRARVRKLNEAVHKLRNKLIVRPEASQPYRSSLQHATALCHKHWKCRSS